jgi:hypothetical protein
MDSTQVKTKDTLSFKLKDSSEQIIKIFNLGIKQTNAIKKRMISCQFGLKKGQTAVLASLGYINGFEFNPDKEIREPLSKSLLKVFGIIPEPFYQMHALNIGFKYRYNHIVNKQSGWFTELTLENNRYYSSGTLIKEIDYSENTLVEMKKGGEFGFGLTRGYRLSTGHKYFLSIDLGYEIRIGKIQGTILETKDNFTGEVSSNPKYNQYDLRFSRGAPFLQLRLEHQF